MILRGFVLSAWAETHLPESHGRKMTSASSKSNGGGSSPLFDRVTIGDIA